MGRPGLLRHCVRAGLQDEAAAVARVRATGRRNRARRSASSGLLAATDAERQAQLEEALATQMAMQRKLHEQLEVLKVQLKHKLSLKLKRTAC